MGEIATGYADEVLVRTADGNYYIVDSESFRSMTLKLLSKCKVVKKITEEAN